MLNDSTIRLHHDIAIMPNGNVLMVAWELKTMEESVEAGRDTAILDQDKLWPEVILEWDPNIDSIVWEWHVWDHLIQDFDNSRENFGVVSDHPELVDLNYDEHDGHPDWLHINALDYNSHLDQIIMSVPYFNEFWIIDHSTTTEEAKSHSGGLSGKGGHLLYRWGNPRTYGVEGGQQQLFFQHDTHWVDPSAEPGEPLFGTIALFNNRLPDNRSTANLITLPWNNSTNSYTFDDVQFGPDDFDIVVQHPNDSRSVSSGLSSVQLLPNDNLLVCSGRWGFSYEMTPSGQVVWEYVTPIVRGAPGAQGDTSLTINANLTFRLKRYGMDFPGFNGRDLTTKGYIETNPDTSYCEQLTTSVFNIEQKSLSIFPNPVGDYLFLKDGLERNTRLFIFDSLGNLIENVELSRIENGISVNHLTPGVYFIRSTQGHVKRFLKI